jgi:hypothetical protein
MGKDGAINTSPLTNGCPDVKLADIRRLEQTDDLSIDAAANE